MKLCSACEQSKPFSAFYTKSKGGYQTYCKVCSNEKRKQWAKDNRERANAHRTYYRYKISPDTFLQMLEDQENRCAMCHGEFSGARQSMKIDHDHSCCPGEQTCGSCIRGILCNSCNVALGVLENKKLVSLAEKYLSKDVQIMGV